MSQPLLSILIPTVVGREEQLMRLLSKFIDVSDFLMGSFPHSDARITHKHLPIEIVIIKDEKQKTIGEKREELYRAASGLFSWQIDDDDSISPDAIKEILDTIKLTKNIDCITFRENCMMNGEYKSCNHSIKYEDWADNQDGFDYVRTPFYKDVIKTEIARSVPFEHIRYGEDHAWSRAIKPLLKTEVHIDRELYFYIYEPKESHNERYGITKG